MSENPLSDRLDAGLSWPAWSDWHLDVPAPPSQPAVIGAPAPPLKPLAPAHAVAEGGPWTWVADSSTSSEQTGPLAGWHFAVKDLFAWQGRPTTAGSPVRADAPAEQATAPIITRLQAAGAVARGTVTLHEFAFGVTGVNDHAGTAPNPAAPDRVPGGSSSGSAAAVADGSAHFALGTDTGGSVRIPSAFCGIAGFKPAHGTYPAHGVFPLSTTLDHVGLHAPSVAAITHVHRALGFEVTPTALPLRIGVARGDIEAADEPVRAAIEAALDAIADSGSTIVDVDWPNPETAFVASTGIMFTEAAAIHAEDLKRAGDRYGADIRARLELGASLTGPQVATAHRLRRQLIDAVSATLAGLDVIASPTVPIVAPLLADAADPALPARIVANTRLANVVGLPAVTMPVATDGPPVGLQLLGATNAATLGTALVIEEILSI